MGAMPKKKHHIRLSAQERNELWDCSLGIDIKWELTQTAA